MSETVAETLAAERLETARRLDASLNTIREACIGSELMRSQIDELAATVRRQSEMIAELTAERDRWKDLATEFRQAISLNPDGSFLCSKIYELAGIARGFDAMTSPPASGALVPWTAETRPRGVVMFREKGDEPKETPVRGWDKTGAVIGWHMHWQCLFQFWEWSRDGITWNPCGVRKAECSNG